MTRGSTAGSGQSASGDRSVAAHTIKGPVATGDNARIVALESGAIPAPEGITLAGQIDNLPRPPTPVFVGRASALDWLARAMVEDASVVVRQAVYGLGGVGKSELALQYAQARRDDYQLMWWITAASLDQLEAGLAALAGRLCPPLGLVGNTQDAAAWAMGWLQGHDRWLLILDNVDDPADVAGLLGQLRGGHILLTSRRDVDWRRIATPMRLDILGLVPAAEIVTARTGYTRDQDRDDAALIAAELGFLPLALDQAAAYMIQTRIHPGQYLSRLRRYPTTMFVRTAGQAQETIARLWDMTIDAIRDIDAGAVRLLQILACYAPDNIPRAILGGPDDDGQIDEQLGLLASYSMITLSEDMVSLHRLVQAVILAMPKASSLGLADVALQWLDNSIPADPDRNMSSWSLLRGLMPHFDAITSRYPADQQPRRLGQVDNVFALFYEAQGEHQRALDLCISALRIFNKYGEPDHPHVAAALGNLASTYNSLGWAGNVLPMGERALQITEAALGPDHPDVATRLESLADIYESLDRHADALFLGERALRITEAALGPDHPDVATRLESLADIYESLDRYADALSLQERALRITEAALGPDHPDVATRLASLAFIYIHLDQYADALSLQERALRITEAALGPDHPDVAFRLHSLGLIYLDLGRRKDWKSAWARADRIKAANGLDKLASMGSLVLEYRALGRAAELLPLKEWNLQTKDRDTT